MIVSEFLVGEVKLDLSSKISLTEKKLTCRKNTGWFHSGILMSPKLNGINRKEKCTLNDLDFTAMMSSLWPFFTTLPEIMSNISSSFNPCHYGWVNAMIHWWKFLIKRALLPKCSPVLDLICLDYDDLVNWWKWNWKIKSQSIKQKHITKWNCSFFRLGIKFQ